MVYTVHCRILYGLGYILPGPGEEGAEWGSTWTLLQCDVFTPLVQGLGSPSCLAHTL